MNSSNRQLCLGQNAFDHKPSFSSSFSSANAPMSLHSRKSCTSNLSSSVLITSLSFDYCSVSSRTIENKCVKVVGIEFLSSFNPKPVSVSFQRGDLILNRHVPSLRLPIWVIEQTLKVPHFLPEGFQIFIHYVSPSGAVGFEPTIYGSKPCGLPVSLCPNVSTA